MGYYKIVRNEGGKLYSPVAKDSGVRTLYIPNEWVQSQIEGTPLFIFIDYPAALRDLPYYSHYYSHAELWQVEVDNPRYVERVLATCQYARDILSFWSEDFFDGLTLTLFSYENVCDKVKLIEKLAK